MHKKKQQEEKGYTNSDQKYTSVHLSWPLADTSEHIRTAKAYGDKPQNTFTAGNSLHMEQSFMDFSNINCTVTIQKQCKLLASVTSCGKVFNSLSMLTVKRRHCIWLVSATC